MQRILIVEDDKTIASAIAGNLRQWQYGVQCVEDFQMVMEDFYAFAPHLVLMDISLPFYNGYHWCQEMRKVSKVPIVFISSASENMNIVMAMQLGGDDYIVKPFDLTVLEAKIQAILRRTYDFGVGTELLEQGGVVLHLQEMIVSYGEQSAELTKNEFKILETLIKKAGEVISREDLMECLWQSDVYIDDNTLTVNVARLRKTLTALGVEDFIGTKRGVGYYVKRT